MKKLVILGLGLLLAVWALAGCGSITSANGKAPVTHATSNAPAPSQSSSAATGSPGTTFAVSDTGTGTSYSVTLNKVVYGLSGANEAYTPDPGKRYVVADFTVRGIKGTTSNNDANSDATIVGSDDQTYSPVFDQVAGYTNFNSGDFTLTPGEKESGAVVFELPDTVDGIRVQWQEFLSDAVGTWELK